MPKAKSVKLHFYECPPAEAKAMFGGFQACYNKKVPPHIDSGWKGRKPEIQMTDLDIYGEIVYGIIRKYHPEKGFAVAKPDRKSKINEFKERPLDLKSKEAVIGKTHFFYDNRRKLLLYEQNSKGVPWKRFSDYVSQLARSRVNLTPALAQESHNQIKRRMWELIKLELKISNNTGTAMSKIPEYAWWEKLAEIFPVASGGAVAVVLSGGKKSPLGSDIFNIALSLLEYNDYDEANRVIATFFDPAHNAVHEVDLIQARLKDEVTAPEVEYITENDGQFSKPKFFEILEQKMGKIEIVSGKAVQKNNTKEKSLLFAS